jgi:hypothetical protein
MAEEKENMTESRNVITPGGYRFVIVWAVCLLLLYAAWACLGGAKLRGYAAESDKTRQARIASPTVEKNVKAADLALPPEAEPVNVMVGGRINRVGEFSLRESIWTADFNLWFSWNSDKVNPGRDFRIVNGQIMQQVNVENARRGKDHYVEYQIAARLTEDFDASRFPFAEDGLFVLVEDITQGTEAIRYVADRQGSGISPEAMPQGMNLIRFMADTKTGIHGNAQASTGLPVKVRSQFLLAMLVIINGLGVYQKLFQALFASVAVSLIALFIRPLNLDCRFGLPVGGFFAAVGNNIFVGTLMPHSDRLTLADMVNATGLFTIFLILVQSVISLHICETTGSERLSRLFDRVSFGVFLIGYVAVNLVLPISAGPL